jgi:hypothetical protein
MFTKNYFLKYTGSQTWRTTLLKWLHLDLIFFLVACSYLTTILLSGHYRVDDRIFSEYTAAAGMDIGRGNRGTRRKLLYNFVHHKSHLDRTSVKPKNWQPVVRRGYNFGHISVDTFVLSVNNDEESVHSFSVFLSDTL